MALPAQQVDAMMEGWNGVRGGRKESVNRRGGPAAVEGLRASVERRMGSDGRIWSALRWEVEVFGSSDLEDEDGVPAVEDGERL